jgi:peptidoglycan/LPS O-acetylase OafA/YrhL
LDGLRGTAAVCILVLHAWLFEYADAGKPDKQAVDLIIGELRLALPMFFVLSGFLLVRPWLKAAAAGTDPPSVRDYLRKRGARILPAYWAAVIGSVILVWGANSALMPPLGHLPLFFAFAQNYDVHSLGRLDPPMWTLGVEMAFYLVLPVIGWVVVRGRTGPKAQIAICLTLIAAGTAFNWWAHTAGAPRTLTTSLLSQAPYFAIGMATAVLCLNRSPPPWLPLAGIALVAADAVWHVNTYAEIEYSIRDIPAGVGFALIVASPPRLFDLLPFRVLGRLSYGLYLWHFPVIVWMRLNNMWPEQGLVIDALVVFVPTLALATLSWALIERPAIAWSHRKPGRRAAVRPEAVRA